MCEYDAREFIPCNNHNSYHSIQFHVTHKHTYSFTKEYTIIIIIIIIVAAKFSVGLMKLMYRFVSFHFYFVPLLHFATIASSFNLRTQIQTEMYIYIL